MNAKFRFFAALSALLLAGCTTPSELDALIARHTEARGGVAAIEAVDNIRARVEIVEPGFTIDGDYRARDGAMRIDIYADGARVFSEGVDADGAWQQDGPGAPIVASTEKGRAALLHGIEFNLFGLHQLRARGHALSLEADETIDGVDYKVVKITLDDGFETYFYLNPETAMIERRRDVRALHPDADPAEKLIENRFTDFVRKCGVVISGASQQVDVKTGDVMQRTRLIEQNCNLEDEELQIERDAAV